MDEYDPWESLEVSPNYNAIVNAKFPNNCFVYIFKFKISAMLFDYKLISQVNSGDFVSVKFKFNRNSRPDQHSRHIIVEMTKIQPPSSILSVSKDKADALITLVATPVQKGIYMNEFVGNIRDNLNKCPWSETRPVVLETRVMLLKKEKINGIVCMKFINFADQNQESSIIRRDSQGLICWFNGFKCGVWSPDYEKELSLSVNGLSLSNFAGKWIRFSEVCKLSDGTLQINENTVQTISDIFPTRIVDVNVEFQVRCRRVEGNYDGCPILELANDVGLAFDPEKFLLHPENDQLQFPREFWFRQSKHAKFNLMLSPENFGKSKKKFQEISDIQKMEKKRGLAEKNLAVSDVSLEVVDEKANVYRGLIMSQVDDACYVWCPNFDRDLLLWMKNGQSRSSLVGKWIAFSTIKSDLHNRIHIMDDNVNLVDEALPTRFYKEHIEILVTCWAEETEDEAGRRIYMSNEVGPVLDIDGIMSEDVSLPFDVYVVRIPESARSSRRRCRWLISLSNRDMYETKPNKMDRRKEHYISSPSSIPYSSSAEAVTIEGRKLTPNHLPLDDFEKRSCSISPPPGYQNSGRSALLTKNSKPQADYWKLMVKDDGGKYSSDDEDHPEEEEEEEDEAEDEKDDIRVNRNENKKMSLRRKSESEEWEDAEVRNYMTDLDKPITKRVTNRTTSSARQSFYQGKTLKELSEILLGNKELCQFFEQVDKKLYHAFANKVYND